MKPGSSATDFEAKGGPIAAKRYRGGVGFERWGAMPCFRGNTPPEHVPQKQVDEKQGCYLSA